MTKFRWALGVALICAGLASAGMAADTSKKHEAKPKWTGSIRVQGKHTPSQLKRMAKLTAQEAAVAALAAVPGNANEKKVKETELEVENGFLIYSVDILVKGLKGEYEVIVDPSTGKVLAQELDDDDDDEDDDDD